MALDLRSLKDANERMTPFREGLEALALLIDAAVESEALVEKTQKLLDAQNEGLAQAKQNLRIAYDDLAVQRNLQKKERDEHKASIEALKTERQKLRDEADNELRAHKIRLQAEMEHASSVHAQNMTQFAAEQAQARKLLEAAQKSLAEMTDRVRQTLGL